LDIWLSFAAAVKALKERENKIVMIKVEVSKIGSEGILQHLQICTGGLRRVGSTVSRTGFRKCADAYHYVF